MRLKPCTFESSFASELSASHGKKGVGDGDEVKCGFLHAHSKQQEEGSGGGLVPGMNRRLCKCVCAEGGVAVEGHRQQQGQHRDPLTQSQPAQLAFFCLKVEEVKTHSRLKAAVSI